MPGISGEVANLIVALKLDDSGFTGRLNAASGTLRRLDGGLSQVGRGVGQVGSGLARLGTVAGVAAAGGLTAVVKTAVSFEDAFAGVKKTVDATEIELSQLRASFREMANEIPLSFEELSAIGEQAGALGIATADIEEFTRVAALIGVTTDVSSDQAATALGQLSNVLGLTSADYERFASTLVDLGNKGASTESQILEIASRAGAGAKLIGIAADETLGWASAVANLGIEVEAGGSSLQTFFLQSAKNLEVTKRLKLMADTAGVSASEFKRAFEEDAGAALETFIVGLGGLDRAARLQVLDDLKLKGIRIQRTLLGLADSGDNLTGSLKNANAEWERNNALQTEAEKRFETTASQMQVFKNRVRDAAATVGSSLLPIVNELTKDFGEFLLKHDAEIDQFGQDLAQGIRGLVTELKGADFSGLIGGMKLAAEVAGRAFDLFRSLPQPVQQLAIAALVANKVSGGAVGQIAKGLGNIVLGGGKLFGGLRGQTPASPMFVSVVGPGGLGGVAAGGGRGGFWGTAGKALGLAFVGVAGIELGKTIAESLGVDADTATRPAVEFERSQFEELLASNDPEELRRGIEAIETGIGQIVNTTGPFGFLFGAQVDELKGQRETLLKLLSAVEQSATPIGQFDPRNPGGTPGSVPRKFSGEIDDIPRVRDEIRALRDDNRAYDGADSRRFASLEQRLIKDKSFAQELTPEKFIRLLKRTSEFGERGVGTGIEVGPTTGRDPFGKAFLALARRLPAEHLKDRTVIGELERHIVAAEEVQARLIEKGDLEGAQKLQRTIDGIHKLLGSVDKTHPLLREQNRQQKETANRIRETRQTMHEAKLALDTSNSKLERIANKDTNVNVTVPVNVTNTVSVRDVIYTSSVVGTIHNNIPIGP